MERKKKKKTLASELNKVITIREKVPVSDGEGGHTVKYKSMKQVWAAIYPIKAVQQFEMASHNVKATHHIKIRGYTLLNEATNDILFGSRVFEILTVENYQESDFTQLVTCKERRG
ncbi:phage head closure protein [Candidatus Saccharibacteria bacterium]|nr:phage head closure protein [Candidatus Saccharibacteria bacterium]NIV03462.1 phage head closure protein [Calditrichia bacterium]NIS38199.1 phage head closure protein [Candidatus Saccharibacteria bacterium]NIV71968.1 phage head closure protein [Calditrichia bacterium]NIV98758.1 phage head closure protein [Candidatus Saccharibacteria bacterium]